jgi:PAS domain S-box-containing protein
LIMKLVSNLSIRNKIILMVLAATFPALLLSNSIFLYNDLKLLKEEILRNLTVQASVVGGNSRSSLIFDDEAMASKTLSSFKTDKQIVSAAIFDSKDKVFASFISDEWPQFEAPTTLEIGRVITEDYIEIVLPIIHENDELGKIYLHAKLYGYKSRQRNILYFSGLTFVGVLIVAYFITINLQGIISKPILALADTATAISKNIDYSLRVSYKGKDEIGKLYSGFNEMLLQIEKRDNKLEAYGKDLEDKVLESDQLAERLANSEARFRQVILDAPIPMMIHDDNGDILMISRMWTEITGYSPSEISTLSNWVSRAYPENTSMVLERIRKVFVDNDFINRGEFEITISDGTQRIWHFYSKSFSDKVDGRTYAVSMAMDITDRKRIENDLAKSQKQLLHAEKLSATGKLSASIAHEFNNPIYGIRNVLEMISEEVPMDRSYQVYMDLAIKECNRMKDLILKLQDFNCPTSGVITLIDINKLIDETALWISKRLNEEKIKLKKNYDERLPEIEGVFDQIKQVILNLLQNAEEAMPLEGGIISITTASYSSVVKIVIQDTGIGIDPENIKKIFEPFYTNKSLVSGTGLGLSLSYGIIKAHGGDIEVESQQGHGTKFTISIPKKREL